jgi:hypothetical protein
MLTNSASGKSTDLITVAVLGHQGVDGDSWYGGGRLDNRTGTAPLADHKEPLKSMAVKT